MSALDKYQRIYDILDSHYGPQNWWPADSPFEVMLGAVLVQNTNWTNASMAISKLKEADIMSASAIEEAGIEHLASLISSSGYFNVKAKRIMALCTWLLEHGGVEQLKRQPLPSLRKDLLAVHGIGPETADDILLYALDKPVFVIDAYTRRLFSRLGMLDQKANYEHLRMGFEQSLDNSAGLFNQYHALVVVHAKNTCKKKPRCNKCCLQDDCLRWKNINP